MRLWHNSLIKVLPRNQLLGQWRELNSISSWKTGIFSLILYMNIPILICIAIRWMLSMRWSAEATVLICGILTTVLKNIISHTAGNIFRLKIKWTTLILKYVSQIFMRNIYATGLQRTNGRKFTTHIRPKQTAWIYK